MIHELEVYTLPDIKRLKATAQWAEENVAGGRERLATSLASICFAVAESIGILLRNGITEDTLYYKSRQAPQEYYLTNNKENALNFFRMMPVYGLPEVTNDDIQIIYTINRNGIVHTLFPKLGSGIAFVSQNAQGKGILYEQDNNIQLNVAFLTDYIIRAIEKVIELYANKKEVKELVDKNYNIITSKQEEDLKANDGFKERIKQRYPVTYKTHWR